MDIRLATLSDLPQIKEVFDIAKNKMKEDGNSLQWNNSDYPFCHTEEDINKKQCYVVTNDKNKVVATFVYIIGEDPTYKYIEGSWINDHPYGTIHRIASNKEIAHVFEIVLNYIKKNLLDIRIDTHEDNKRMIHLIEKNHFVYCGIIYIKDGSPRRAYQLVNTLN